MQKTFSDYEVGIGKLVDKLAHAFNKAKRKTKDVKWKVPITLGKQM